MKETALQFTVETEQEDDGRWIAEALELPGVLAYGPIHEAALASAQALALRVVAERLEHGEESLGPDEYLIRSSRMSQWPATKARRVLAVLLRIGWRIKRAESTKGKCV